MTDDRKNRKPESDKDEESAGQYGGLEHGIGPGGGTGFEKVKRPARPDPERPKQDEK